MTKKPSARRTEDFKATADSIATAAERVAELEAEKQTLSPDDPRANELAREVEAIVDEMDRDTAIQRSLTENGPNGREALAN